MIIRLYGVDLHADIWGKGPWVLATPIKATRVWVGVMEKVLFVTKFKGH